MHGVKGLKEYVIYAVQSHVNNLVGLLHIYSSAGGFLK